MRAKRVQKCIRAAQTAFGMQEQEFHVAASACRNLGSHTEKIDRFQIDGILAQRLLRQ
jgi:hypothetical protein